MGRAITIKYNKNNKTERFLMFLLSKAYYRVLEHYAQKGVMALVTATPVDSGVTADSWGYKIKITDKETTITWTNSNTTEDGIPIVVLIEYGHATRNGGYVEPNEFIDPALEPIFKNIADSVWMEVNKHK